MKEDTRINTIEELVQYAIRMRKDDRKYKLDRTVSYVYVDEAAGETWEEEESKLEYVPFNDEGRAAYDAKREELDNRQPKKEPISNWYLSNAQGWRYDVIHLSAELAEAIEKIWTHGEIRWGSPELKGRLTLAGILKRLGRSEVAEQIKAAEKAEQALIDKRNRNYYRKQIREKSQELYNLLTSKDVGIDWETSDSDLKFFSRLAKLTKLLDEE